MVELLPSLLFTSPHCPHFLDLCARPLWKKGESLRHLLRGMPVMRGMVCSATWACGGQARNTVMVLVEGFGRNLPPQTSLSSYSVRTPKAHLLFICLLPVPEPSLLLCDISAIIRGL